MEKNEYESACLERCPNGFFAWGRDRWTCNTLSKGFLPVTHDLWQVNHSLEVPFALAVVSVVGFVLFLTAFVLVRRGGRTKPLWLGRKPRSNTGDSAHASPAQSCGRG